MRLFRYKTPVIAILFVAALLAGAYLGGSYFLPDISGSIKMASESVNESSAVGKRAPHFDLPDLSGKHVKLSDFAGEPLVVVFWTTWNSEAKDQITILDDFLGRQSQYEGLVHIVAIDSQEEKSIVSSFMRRGGYAVETLLDTQGIASNAYGVTGVPAFFFIDRTRTVRESVVGVLSERMIGDNIEKIVH